MYTKLHRGEGILMHSWSDVEPHSNYTQHAQQLHIYILVQLLGLHITVCICPIGTISETLSACRARNVMPTLIINMWVCTAQHTDALSHYHNTHFSYSLLSKECDTSNKCVIYTYLRALGWDCILYWPLRRYLLVSSGITFILHMTWVTHSVHLCMYVHEYKTSTDCTRSYTYIIQPIDKGQGYKHHLNNYRGIIVPTWRHENKLFAT